MTTFALVFSSKFLQGGWCERQLTSDCISASSLDPHLSWRGFRPELSPPLPPPPPPKKRVAQKSHFLSMRKKTANLNKQSYTQ
jgi:hypothetical protein